MGTMFHRILVHFMAFALAIPLVPSFARPQSNGVDFMARKSRENRHLLLFTILRIALNYIPQRRLIDKVFPDLSKKAACIRLW